MKPLPDWLELEIPEAPNLNLPPPVLGSEELDRFLTAMHEEAVRTGAYAWPDSPLRQPFPEMFVLVD